MMGSLNNYTGGRGQGDISPGRADHSRQLTSEESLISIHKHFVPCSRYTIYSEFRYKESEVKSLLFLLVLIKLDAAVF